MPNGSTVQNVDTDLTTVPGWLGIKTGSTSQAGGCLLFAAQHRGPLGGAAEVEVVGAILGQTTPDGDVNQELEVALDEAANAVNAAFDAYQRVDPSTLTLPALAGHGALGLGDRAGPHRQLRDRRAPRRGADRRHAPPLGDRGAPCRRVVDHGGDGGRPRDRQPGRHHRRHLERHGHRGARRALAGSGSSPTEDRSRHLGYQAASVLAAASRSAWTAAAVWPATSVATRMVSRWSLATIISTSCRPRWGRAAGWDA